MGIKRQAINYGAKQRIVVNFNTGKIISKPHFGTLWVKKDDEGKDRSFCFFFGPYIKLRTENLPI